MRHARGVVVKVIVAVVVVMKGLELEVAMVEK
jgi:hypothetical protein